MKVGDLVRYIGRNPDDDVIGVVATVSYSHDGDLFWFDAPTLPWATVIWSLPSGVHHDKVPLEDLEIVNESR